jgi:hypothetical protein
MPRAAPIMTDMFATLRTARRAARQGRQALEAARGGAFPYCHQGGCVMS